MDSFREYTLQLGAVFQEWRTFPRALRDDASRVAVGTFTFQHFPIQLSRYSALSVRARGSSDSELPAAAAASAAVGVDCTVPIVLFCEHKNIHKGHATRGTLTSDSRDAQRCR